MSKFKRYIKNIHKQYGKNIKAFESVLDEMRIPKEIEAFYKKHNLDLTTRIPAISILHKRWGFASRTENKINSYEDIERIANEN